MPAAPAYFFLYPCFALNFGFAGSIRIICLPRRICFKSPRFFQPLRELKIFIKTSLVRPFYPISAKNQVLIEMPARMLHNRLMKAKKSLLSAFLSAASIPVVVLAVLLDKPDYRFFNFLHKSIVPTFEAVGQGMSWPVRMIGDIRDGIRSKRGIADENKYLREQMGDFQKMAAELEILRLDNDLLRRKLRMAENMRFSSVFAKILRDNSFLENQQFIIKSRDPGIAAGNAAVSNDGYLIGIIAERAGGYAKLRSLRDSRSNIPVRIAGTDIFGFLQGVGGRRPELRFLSSGDFIPEIGMILITSGVNGNVPDDLPVGKIGALDDKIRVELGSELRDQENAVILLFGKDGKYE
jgi:cell shape-determining protein MreC